MISIVIPVYNAEKTILNTLNSIKAQTDDAYEVIMVNDGSTDKSLEVIEKFISSLSEELRDKFHVYSTENRGVSSARNLGIEKATGEYILFVDADDEIAQDTIKILSKSMDKGMHPVFTWTDNKKNFMLPFDHKRTILNLKSLIELYAHRNYRIVFLSILYNRKLLTSYSIKFDSNIKYGEDNLFFWQYVYGLLTKKELRFCLFEKPLYYYSKNSNSAMHKGTKEQADAIKAIKIAMKYFINTEYYSIFKKYLYPRTVLSVINNYAKTGSAKLYNAAIERFYTKDIMSCLVKYGEPKLRMSGILVRKAPLLNYFIIHRMYKST